MARENIILNYQVRKSATDVSIFHRHWGTGYSIQIFQDTFRKTRNFIDIVQKSETLESAYIMERCHWSDTILHTTQLIGSKKSEKQK